MHAGKESRNQDLEIALISFILLFLVNPDDALAGNRLEAGQSKLEILNNMIFHVVMDMNRYTG